MLRFSALISPRLFLLICPVAAAFPGPLHSTLLRLFPTTSAITCSRSCFPRRYLPLIADCGPVRSQDAADDQSELGGVDELSGACLPSDFSPAVATVAHRSAAGPAQRQVAARWPTRSTADPLAFFMSSGSIERRGLIRNVLLVCSRCCGRSTPTCSACSSLRSTPRRTPCRRSSRKNASTHGPVIVLCRCACALCL